MRDILATLQDADYQFIVQAMRSRTRRGRGRELNDSLDDYLNRRAAVSLEKLMAEIERELRYLGSNDLVYLARRAAARGEPGAPLSEIIDDAAKKLKVSLKIAPEAEKLAELTGKVVSGTLADLPQEDLIKLLTGNGVTREQAEELVKRHGKTVTLSMIASFIGSDAVERLVKTVAVRVIGRYLGREAIKKILEDTAARFPWWAEWIGPAMWVVTATWLTIDIAGPAYRKTIPILLYLGICLIRNEKYRTILE